jgi:hypothetical protein
LVLAIRFLAPKKWVGMAQKSGKKSGKIRDIKNPVQDRDRETEARRTSVRRAFLFDSATSYSNFE